MIILGWGMGGYCIYMRNYTGTKAVLLQPMTNSHSQIIITRKLFQFQRIYLVFCADYNIHLSMSSRKQVRVTNTPIIVKLGFTGVYVIFSSPEPLGSQGELIVYPSSRRPSVRRRRPSSVVVHNAQRSSSPKPLGRSKPNFMWSLLG